MISIKKVFLTFLCLLFSLPVNSLCISDEDTQKIAKKIWQNECKGTVSGLTSWNEGEDFASLGIGHFIWYPESKKERFQETFPALLSYFEKRGITLPLWLKNSKSCPWKTKKEFEENKESLQMKQLRDLLVNTLTAQACFLAQRLENSLPLMLEKLSEKDQKKVSRHFHTLAKTSKGLYALLDYVNFKGEGILPEETYQGQGWGLLQVLLEMPEESLSPIQDFVKAAKKVLIQRVLNSPPERNEQRWLRGWLKRIESYTETT